MCNKLFPKDDPAALDYVVAQRAAAGYEDEAWMIKHESGLAEMIYKLFIHFSRRGRQGFVDAWKGVRQVPGALRRWWHECFQLDMQVGDDRGKHPLFTSAKGKG